jgi:hypothetical protein
LLPLLVFDVLFGALTTVFVVDEAQPGRATGERVGLGIGIAGAGAATLWSRIETGYVLWARTENRVVYPATQDADAR